MREDDTHVISYAFNEEGNGLILFLGYTYHRHKPDKGYKLDISAKPIIFMQFCFMDNHCVREYFEAFKFEQYHHACMVAAHQTDSVGSNHRLVLTAYLNGVYRNSGTNFKGS